MANILTSQVSNEKLMFPYTSHLPYGVAGTNRESVLVSGKHRAVLSLFCSVDPPPSAGPFQGRTRVPPYPARMASTHKRWEQTVTVFLGRIDKGCAGDTLPIIPPQPSLIL